MEAMVMAEAVVAEAMVKEIGISVIASICVSMLRVL